MTEEDTLGQNDFGLITRPYLHTAADSFNNLIIAFCLDGTVYALDSENGSILWRTSGSFTEGPLLKKRKRSPNSKVEYLIEPLGDGAIFQVEAEEIKRLPFTLKSLVQMSPVHWQETEEKSLYLIAKRESSIFVLDLISGRVKKRQFKDSGSNSENSDEEMALEALERASLLVGRTDYHVQGFDEGNLEAQWEITMTQFKSLHSGPADNLSDDFYTTFNGHLVSKQADGPWIAKLESPVLQVFRPMATPKGYITLQEIELKGSASGAVAAKRHVLFDQNKATFYFDDLVNVGVLNLQGNSTLLFVLPQSHYPLLRERKKPTIGEEDEIALVVSRHQFVSMQRVSRQTIPPIVKLLNYEDRGFTSSKIILTGLIVLTSIFVFWWRMKRQKKLGDKKALVSGGILELSEEVLGYGSHGTVVFRGKFDGRPVAIKRLLSEFYSLADREISLLQEHDTHPNVVRYFYREQQERFILVALELAHFTLHEFIDPFGAEIQTTSSSDGLCLDGDGSKVSEYQNVNVNKIELLRQVMEGLEFLHGKGLIHRDLKPQNILLQFGKADSVRVLISDFGLSKKLVEMESSFHATAKASGTLGWRAPEIIFNEESVKFMDESGDDPAGVGPMKIGRSVDIFAAGLIFYFVLSGGKHAFGSRMMRESNISTGKLEINSEVLSCEAEDLIRKMLRKRPKDRPTAREVLLHPFFWDAETRLDFVCSVSDVLEAEERNLKRDLPPGFENSVQLPMRDAIDLVGGAVYKEATWHKHLDRQIFQDLTKHRYYMVNKLHDLLRAIRNKRNHFHETPVNIQEILGSSPIEAWKYFESKFPRMLMQCYLVMKTFESGNDTFRSLEKFYR